MKKVFLTLVVLMATTQVFASRDIEDGAMMSASPFLSTTKAILLSETCVFSNDCSNKETLLAAKNDALMAVANNFESDSAVLKDAVQLVRSMDAANQNLSDAEIILAISSVD